MNVVGGNHIGAKLTLRKKTILILGLTLTGLLIVMYFAVSRIVTGGFSEVETAETARNVDRAVDAISNEVADLDRITRDWASWDDTYAFIEDHNQAFVSSNLDTESSWVNNRLNLMMFIDASGDIVYAGGFDLEGGTKVPVSPGMSQLPGLNDGQLRRHDDLSAGYHGLILLPEGPVLVSSRPILTSDSEGPSRGTLIWGRYLNGAELDRISVLVHLPVAVQIAGGSSLPGDFGTAEEAIAAGQSIYVSPLGNDAIAGYAAIADIFGNPGLTLRVDTPRDIYNEGRSTLLYFGIAILIVGLTFGLITLLLLERSVISRMARVSSRVRDIGEREDLAARIDIAGTDEVSGLAAVINQMLAGLERSQTDLARSNAELDRRIEQRTAQLQAMQTLADIDREIASTMESRKVLSLACRRVTELLRAPKSLVIIAGESGKTVAGASFGIVAGESQSRLDEDLRDTSFIERLQSHTAGAAYAACDAEKGGPLLPRFFEHEMIASYAAAPLMAEGQKLGLLLVMDTVGREWNEDQMRVLELISGQVAVALEQARLFEQEQERRGELASLYSLSKVLADAAPVPGLMMDIITRQAVQTIHTTHAQIATMEGRRLVIQAFNPIRHIEHAQQVGRQTPLSLMPVCSRIMNGGVPEVVACEDSELTEHERQFLLADTARTMCLVPLQTSGRVLGLLILGEDRNRERETFTSEKLRLASSIADQAVSALRRAELFAELENAYLQAVTALAKAVDAKDTYTANHGKKLGIMAVAVGRRMGLIGDDLEDLRLGAILHDVGKIGIPDAILQKSLPLDEQEWEKIRMHPVIGEQILEPIPRLSQVARIVRHHHERFDGGGYPDGIAGNQIPIGARILSVVDSYSAIVDLRAYSMSRSHAEAVRELELCAGTQFDPVIVDIFIDVLDGGILDMIKDDSLQNAP